MAQFDTSRSLVEDPALVRSRAAAVQSATSPEHAAVLRLQREAGNAAVTEMLTEQDPHGIDRVLQSGGRPLETSAKVQMESALGADFSDVRIHTGQDADRSAASLGANAYTMGSDIVFSEGGYDPASDSGQRTLAHELTHVVQQRSGPVDGTMTDTGVALSDPSDRFEREAEATAAEVVSGGRAEGLSSAGPTAATGAVAQREEVGEEEEPVQTERADAITQREQPEEEEMPGA